MKRFIVSVFTVLLAGFAGVAQETEEIVSGSFELRVRHNGSPESWQAMKIGLPGGPLVPGFRGQEHYYNEGIGAVKMRKCLFYRLWVDYYNYKNEGVMTFVDTTISDIKYQWLYSGIRLSPGLGKEWKWKFMDFRAGADLQVYFRMMKTDQMVSYNLNTNDKTMVWSQTYSTGLNQFGVTAFGGIDFHFLKRMSAGIEVSNGVLFQRNPVYEQKDEYYDAQGKLYKTRIYPPREPGWEKKPRWFYLIPSLSLSYRL